MAPKSKKQTSPVSMMSILDGLRKEYGNDACFSGSDEVLERADPISTGSYTLDDTIGILGVPRGRITQFAGAEASGKSFMALQTIKRWQSQHKDNWAFWIDAEYSFNSDWAKKLGVDTNRLIIMPENMGSIIFDHLCGIPDPKFPEDRTKKEKTGLLDMLIDQGEENRCGVIVIDSIASIIPPVEATKAVGHQNMAPMARFMPPAVRRLSKLVFQSNVAFIAINQLRLDPGVTYGNPETTPGGKAWKHHCRLMINFAKVNAALELILNAAKEPIGHTVNAKIQKNSFAIPRNVKFVIKYLEGVADTSSEMLDLGVKYGIIHRPNNTWYHYGDLKLQGRAAAEVALQDPSVFSEVWEKVKVARENSLVEESKVATKEMLGLVEDESEEASAEEIEK